MNANFLNNLVTELIVTKEDIIIALTEAEVEGWKRSMKKAELMEVLVNAIEEAEAEAINKEDIMNTEAKNTEAEVKVIDSNKAHVEAEAHVTSLEAEEAIISVEGGAIALSSKRRAEAFYRIATMKLYEVLKDEEGNICKSFKSYVNDFRGGEVYGVKYAMAMHYVNLCKYVYPQYRGFEFFGTHLLVNLIKPLKNEETRGEVLEAVKCGILNENMTSKEFKEALEALVGGEGNNAEAEAEVSAEAEAEEGNEYATSNTCEVSDEAIDNAVDMMETFLEANAHDSEVTHAWHIILKALDR